MQSFSASHERGTQQQPRRRRPASARPASARRGLGDGDGGLLSSSSFAVAALRRRYQGISGPRDVASCLSVLHQSRSAAEPAELPAAVATVSTTRTVASRPSDGRSRGGSQSTTSATRHPLDPLVLSKRLLEKRKLKNERAQRQGSATAAKRGGQQRRRQNTRSAGTRRPVSAMARAEPAMRSDTVTHQWARRRPASAPPPQDRDGFAAKTGPMSAAASFHTSHNSTAFVNSESPPLLMITRWSRNEGALDRTRPPPGIITVECN